MREADPEFAVRIGLDQLRRPRVRVMSAGFLLGLLLLLLLLLVVVVLVGLVATLTQLAMG